MRIGVIMYRKCMAIMNAYTPKLAARVLYYKTYKKRLNLKEPRSLSEKLLWLRFNTYCGNRKILKLCDKYDVREYIEEKGAGDTLNELYDVWDDVNDIDWSKLPSSFALKISQGWATNILCSDKSKLNANECLAKVAGWMKSNKLYDRNAANIGGVKPFELKKHIICEKYLGNADESTPSDYKIYCFHGVPKAILYIGDRFGNKKGCFMSTDWRFINHVDKSYVAMQEQPKRPKSLERMLSVAKDLSAPFPFVRVDFYDVAGKAVFGEMTFFPSGCIGMQETSIEGQAMADMLHVGE